MKTQTPARAARLALGLAVPALVVAALFARASAQEPGPATRAGEAMDNAGRKVKEGFQNAFAKSKLSVHDQEVVTRVYSRLHWDKYLVGSTLELEVIEGGAVILRGAVTDAAAKKRAVILARDTVGVTSVEDELIVAPPTQAVTTPVAPVTTVAPPASQTVIIKP